jgi:hypothetical protein
VRLLVVAPLLLLAACGGTAPPRASEGVLDLSRYDFARDGAFVIKGEWLFNWNELVTPASTLPADGALPLRKWNGLKLFDGRELDGRGFATYRMRIVLPTGAASEPFTVVLDPVIDACKLWATTPGGVHGPIGSGEVGTTRETSHGALRRSQLTVAAGDELSLTLQVSNFEHARGGSPGAGVLIGTASAVEAYVARQRMSDFFFVGLLAITGLHHLGLWVLRRREKAPLWFAVMCLLIALRMLLLGRYPQSAWPSLPTRPLHRIEYLTFYLPVGAATLFLRALFPKDLPAGVIKAFTIIALVFSATLLFPTPVYSGVVPVFQLLTFLAIAIGVVGVVRAALRDRDAPPVLVLIGLVALGVAAGLDILRERSVVHIRFIAQYGLTVFVISQSALLALLNQRRAKQLELRNDEVQRLNSELGLLNDELRRQIASRSHELSQALMVMARSSEPRVLEAGAIVDKQYRIVGPIGEGGMGTVYRAERLSDERAVALKLIRGGADPESLARFAREAEVVASIDHPSVVGILDFDVSQGGTCYLVMELVEGRSLEADRHRFGDVAWALPLVTQLAQALAAIHARDVIHRDVKPSNLLIADGRLKLADFGVAQIRRVHRPLGSTQMQTMPGGRPVVDADPTADLALTRAGMMIGSPMYMAPELSEGSGHGSTKSDIFSLGLVAYEMLAGRRAYPRPLVMAAMEGLAMADPAPLSSLVSGVTDEVAEVVHTCLDTEPGRRPDAAAVQAAFERALSTAGAPPAERG